MRIKKLSNFRYLIYTYLILLIVMFALPFFSIETYSIVKNTTSHLGSQNTHNAWIMNITFILVGISCLLESFLHLGKFWFQKILLIIFGLGFVFTGIFCNAPIIEGIPYNSINADIKIKIRIKLF